MQSESGRERISTSLHFEAASRSGPQLIQQFRDVLHHEISSGKFKQISFHQILLHHWMLFYFIKKNFFFAVRVAVLHQRRKRCFGHVSEEIDRNVPVR